MSVFETRPEFQAGLKKLKDNFREHMLDLMSNDGDGMVEIINDDASAQVPDWCHVDAGHSMHIDWMNELVVHLEEWVEGQLQTEVKDGN